MSNPICSNPEDYFGNKYNTNSNNLIIIQITKNNLICLTRNELKMVLDEKPPVIEYSKNSAQMATKRENPKYWFYRLPQLGLWIDHTLEDAYNKKANTLKMVKMPKQINLFKSLGESGLYNHITSYFQVKPISRKNLFGDDIEDEKYTVFTDSDKEDEIIEVNMNEEELKNIMEYVKKEAEKRFEKRKIILNSHNSRTIPSLSFSPDSKYIATGSLFPDMSVKIWDINSEKCIHTMREHSGNVFSVCFSYNGKFIASGSADTCIKIWDSKTGECLNTLKSHSEFVQSVSYSPDDRFLVSGSSDGTVKIWNPNSGECLDTLEEHLGGVKSVSVSSNNLFIASGSSDGSVKIWEMKKSESIHTLQGHTGPVNSVSFSPDVNYIVSGSDDKSVKIWNVQTGDCMYTLEGHSDRVSSVSFSPDGKYITSGSWDKTVKIWDVKTQKCIRTIQEESSVRCVSYSPNNKLLASGCSQSSTDNTVPGDGLIIIRNIV